MLTVRTLTLLAVRFSKSVVLGCPLCQRGFNGLFLCFVLGVEGVENEAIKRGNHGFTARRVRLDTVGIVWTFVRRIVLLSISSKRFFPLGAFVWVCQLGIRLLGDLTEDRRVTLLRFGRWEGVGILHDISVGATVARAVNDTLALG